MFPLFSWFDVALAKQCLANELRHIRDLASVRQYLGKLSLISSPPLCWQAVITLTRRHETHGQWQAILTPTLIAETLPWFRIPRQRFVLASRRHKACSNGHTVNRWAAQQRYFGHICIRHDCAPVPACYGKRKQVSCSKLGVTGRAAEELIYKVKTGKEAILPGCGSFLVFWKLTCNASFLLPLSVTSPAHKTVTQSCSCFSRLPTLAASRLGHKKSSHCRHDIEPLRKNDSVVAHPAHCTHCLVTWSSGKCNLD